MDVNDLKARYAAATATEPPTPLSGLTIAPLAGLTMASLAVEVAGSTAFSVFTARVVAEMADGWAQLGDQILASFTVPGLGAGLKESTPCL